MKESYKPRRIIVTQTHERIFLVRNIHGNGWALVGKRGNYYANEKNIRKVIQHIDQFLKSGKYELK